jgi:hypothetical protein
MSTPPTAATDTTRPLWLAMILLTAAFIAVTPRDVVYDLPTLGGMSR